MKVIGTIRNEINANLTNLESLKSKVDQFFDQNRESRWHYESRIKGEESYALKLETGRFSKLNAVNDLLHVL